MPFSNLACAFRQLLIGAAFVVLMGLTPAYSQTTWTFGRLSPGTIPSSGLSSEMKRASRFTLRQPGSISKLCAYLDGKGGVSGSQRFRLALYEDVSGTPGQKMFDTAEQTISSGTAARWYCIDAPLLPVGAADYWIAIHTGGTAGVIRDFYDGLANWYGNADAFDDGAAMPFGAGNTGSGTLTVCAEFLYSGDVRSAGKIVVGSVPSGGMTADFKRGSSFTMIEHGKLFGVTAYLDGNGSPSLAGQVQQLRYVIYSDANGVPGTKVYESAPLSVRGGAPAMWRADVADKANAPTLDAGRYWLVIHTGSVSGVTRNFSDGLSGNWYGNADTFSDGASTQFGAGNSGNGTISAFVSYRPGTITSGTVGRTDIAPTPSGGLTANVTRWSQFELREGGATLTGLHAYLDGLGAASGAQTVRMAIYNLQTTHGATWYVKLAESSPLTISAGTNPIWLEFPVPSTPLPAPGTYIIAIQTGDTGGVARDYGDTRPNPGGDWNSISDAFADGALTTIPYDSYPPLPGGATMSVYASYSVPPQ